jgi:hypothetical protein
MLVRFQPYPLLEKKLTWQKRQTENLKELDRNQLSPLILVPNLGFEPKPQSP